MSGTLITAHNGADGTPENSMEYVRHALASGADILEIDIRKVPDGTLVFTHDLPADLSFDSAKTGDSGCSGLLPVSDVFLALKETAKRINCDLKEPNLEEDVAALAARCGVSDRILFSGTVSAGRCRESGLTGRVEILLNIEEYIPGLYDRCREDAAQIPMAAREICGICRHYGIGCVNANYHLATDPFIDILMSEKIGLSVWTVNSPAEAAHFLGRGVYSLTTRNLKEILALRKDAP